MVMPFIAHVHARRAQQPGVQCRGASTNSREESEALRVGPDGAVCRYMRECSRVDVRPWSGIGSQIKRACLLCPPAPAKTKSRTVRLVFAVLSGFKSLCGLDTALQ